MNPENQAAFAAILHKHTTALETVESFTEAIREAVNTGDASLIPTEDQAHAVVSAADTVRRRLLAELRIAADRNAPTENPFAPHSAPLSGVLEQ